jgi:hypothetical protein
VGGLGRDGVFQWLARVRTLFKHTLWGLGAAQVLVIELVIALAPIWAVLAHHLGFAAAGMAAASISGPFPVGDGTLAVKLPSGRAVTLDGRERAAVASAVAELLAVREPAAVGREDPVHRLVADGLPGGTPVYELAGLAREVERQIRIPDSRRLGVIYAEARREGVVSRFVDPVTLAMYRVFGAPAVALGEVDLARLAGYLAVTDAAQAAGLDEAELLARTEQVLDDLDLAHAEMLIRGDEPTSESLTQFEAALNEHRYLAGPVRRTESADLTELRGRYAMLSLKLTEMHGTDDNDVGRDLVRDTLAGLIVDYMTARGVDSVSIMELEDHFEDPSVELAADSLMLDISADQMTMSLIAGNPPAAGFTASLDGGRPKLELVGPGGLMTVSGRYFSEHDSGRDDPYALERFGNGLQASVVPLGLEVSAWQLAALVWRAGIEVLAVDDLRIYQTRLDDQLVEVALWRGELVGVIVGGDGSPFQLDALFRALRTSVRVSHPLPGNRLSRNSGVVVAPEYTLTVAHGVERAGTPAVLVDGEPADAVVFLPLERFGELAEQAAVASREANFHSSSIASLDGPCPRLSARQDQSPRNHAPRSLDGRSETSYGGLPLWGVDAAARTGDAGRAGRGRGRSGRSRQLWQLSL